MENRDQPIIVFDNEKGFNGLTKREYFAALAMQGILSNGTIVERLDLTDGKTLDTLSTAFLEIADSLLKKLNE